MKLIEKLVVLLMILGLGILPVCARIHGNISRKFFYDNDKTIMTQIPIEKDFKTEKYWDKNLLYFGKYSPLFMLSNKELIDLMPREKMSIVQRITTPSVYSISLKNSSIKTISFAAEKKPKKTSITKKNTTVNSISNIHKEVSELAFIYNQAKSPEVEPEKKLEAALLLKDSKNTANYPLAMDLLNDVITKEPYNAYAFYLKGELYAEQNSPDSAMKNYVEALKLNPTSKQCCLGIAKILESTNKDLAQKYYDRAKLCEN